MSARIPAEVFSPGEFVREELEARGWTQTDLAEILGRPYRLVNEIVAGKKSITPETAQGLGEAFGTDPLFWLNLESAYRLSLRRMADGAIARKARLYKIAPIKDMLKRHWIQATDDIEKLEHAVMEFFELASVDEEPRFRASTRKKTDYTETTPAQLAWLFRAKQLAASIKPAPYREENLSRLFASLRNLTVHEREIRKVPRLLAEHGIRLVVVEHLPKTRIDGAAFWLDPVSPVVCLSVRYDRIDGFWFTLGHELAHIKNNDQRDGVNLDNDLVRDGPDPGSAGKPESERLADAFACDLLVPQTELESFIARVRPHYSLQALNRFANRIQVHPGIILGQLQHRDQIWYSQWRDLLVKVREQLIQSCLTDGWGHRPSAD